MFARFFKSVTPSPRPPQPPPTTVIDGDEVFLPRDREQPRTVPIVDRLSFSADLVTRPPAAATVELIFGRQYPSTLAIDIPKGTRVLTNDEVPGLAQAFMTGHDVRLEPGQDQVAVLAFHAEFVSAERLGVLTAGDCSWTIARTPLVAATSADLEVVIGVACDPHEVQDHDRVVTFEGQTYLVWSEAGSPWAADPGGRLFIADRLAGQVTLVPATTSVEATTGAGRETRPREVRAWYWRGGGRWGNVAAHTLTVLPDSLRGLVVTNPCSARGGRDAGPITLLRERAFHAAQAAMAS